MRVVTFAAVCLVGLAGASAVSPPPRPTEKDVYRLGLDALVDVVVVSAESGMHGGSGALVSPTLVVTAAHVVKVNAKGKFVGLIAVARSLDVPANAEADPVMAVLVRRDADADLALLRLATPLPGARALELGPAPEVGDAVFYFGNPDEAPTTFGRGVETRLNYPGKDKKRWCQFNGFVWPGMSGGPLLDDRGRLVGIMTAMNAVADLFVDDLKVAVPQIGYHVPVRDVARLLEDLP